MVNKTQKLKTLCEEEKSSTDGKTPHYHPIMRDENNKITGHGSANVGPKHKHPIESNNSDIILGQAGNTDPNDPTHIHTIG